MAFNPELTAKAHEQRLTGIERSIDALRKATQSGAKDPRIKTLEDRLAKLESVVKVLVETRTASKVDAMEKSLVALSSAKLIDQKSFDETNKANDEKRRADADARIKKAQEESNRTNKAYVDKVVAENQKVTDSLKLEARLNLLEAKVKVLER